MEHSTQWLVSMLAFALICTAVGCSVEVEESVEFGGFAPAKVHPLSGGKTVQVEASEQVIRRPPLWRIIGRNSYGDRIVFWSSEELAHGQLVGVCRSISPANDANDEKTTVETACLDS